MSKSMKILIILASIVGFLYTIGMFYNPPQILKYELTTDNYDKKEVDKELEKLNLQEQKKYLSDISSMENRLIAKEDDNEYIGDKVIKTEESNVNGLYIVFSKNDSESEKIRKIIKKYYENNNSYNYKIIYQEFEVSNLIGLGIYNRIKNESNMGLSDIPSIFLIENNKVIFETNDYKNIPDII